MKCWHCNNDVIWGGDHTFEDYCLEGEGIVRCSQCGSFLDRKARMNKIFSDADDALDRFYNKIRKKK